MTYDVFTSFNVEKELASDLSHLGNKQESEADLAQWIIFKQKRNSQEI